MRFYMCLLSVLTLSMALYGCGDSHDDSRTKNLSVTRIDSGSSFELQAHDPLHVFYDLKVEGFNDIDVDIYFYALHINELNNYIRDSDYVEMDHYYELGHIVVDNASEGDIGLSATLTLPPEMNGGEYKVIAMVDPYDRHDETVENDNHPSDENTEYAYTNIHVAELSHHDFIIDTIELGSNAIILDKPDTETKTTRNHSELIGYIDAIYEGKADTEALLHASVYINDMWNPVTFWDHENNEYSESDAIIFTHTDYQHHFGFDLNFSHEILQLLYQQYSSDIVNSLQIKFEIENIHSKKESLIDNNFKIVSIPYYFFDSSSSENEQIISLQTSINETSTGLMADFGHTFGDKDKAAARLVVGSGLVLNPFNKSISLISDARVYSYIFSAESELIKVEAEKRYILGSGMAQNNFYFYAFGNKVFEIIHFDDQSKFKKEWEEWKNLAEMSFMVGPVPLRVAAGVDGQIGYDIGLGFGYNETLNMNYTVSLVGKLIDDLDLNLFVNGGINLAVTKAGVEANLKLIQESFIIQMTAGLGSDNGEWSGSQLGYGMLIENDINAISGTFGLFAEVDMPKFCKRWGIPYFCGFKWNKYHLWLYQTDSVYKKNWVIFEESGYKTL